MGLKFWGGLLIVSARIAAQTYTSAAYPVPTSTAVVTSTTAGPDGNLWFTEFEAGKVGFCTPTGQISEISLAAIGGANPFGIATGSDGNLWFTDYAQGFIVRMTISGSVTRYLIPTPNSLPTFIVAGPDGGLWFLESGAPQIGRVDSSGNFREYPVPGNSVHLEGIAIGSDGALWFTDAGSNRIGRFDLVSAGFTTFPVPFSGEIQTLGSVPFSIFPVTPVNEIQTLGLITAGPDGALWFTEPETAEIGRIDISGNITQFSLPAGMNYPFGIGSNGGAVLFTASGGTIGRITTDGAVSTALQTPMSASTYFTTLANGPDGALWFGAEDSNTGGTIGRVAPPMKIALGTVPDGYLKVAYSRQLLAQYAAGPVVWSVTGSLPPGLSLDTSTGQITGSPIATGTFSFSVSAIDSSSPPQTATQNFTINISAPQFVALTTYDLPPNSNPGLMRSITSGPDGNLWFTEQTYIDEHGVESGTNRIDRISTSGVLSQFNEKIPFGNGPSAIIAAPDGNLWFILQGSAMGGEIDTSGIITRRALSNTAMTGIAVASDGSIWIGGEDGVEVVSSDGSDKTSLLPAVRDSLAGPALGRDGGMWLGSSAAIWRMSGNGMSYFPLASTVQPVSLTSTADSSIWFTEANSANIRRLGTSGQLSAFSIPSGDSGAGITTDAAGNVWFAGKQNVIGRMTSAGNVIEYPVGGAHGITNGPDGAIWFVQDQAHGHIGRLAPVPPLLTSFVLPPGEVGRPYGPVGIATQGGTPPYNWTLAASSLLPPGVNFDPLSGVLSGIPTASGSHRFVVQVSDQSLPYAQSVNQTVTMSVSAPLSLGSSSAGNFLADATVHNVYSANVAIEGGTAPYSCSLLTGSLPAGLSLAGCTIAGTAVAAGSSSFTIGVTDGINATATASYSLRVKPATSSSGGTPSPTPPSSVSAPEPKISLTGMPATRELTGPVSLSVSLEDPAKIDTTGTVSLSFDPSPADLPAGYIDPALQFVDSGIGTKYGTSYTFTIPAGATSVTLPEIEPGTVAGTLSLALTMVGHTIDSAMLTIPESVPVIEPNSVQTIVNSSMGFWVELTASSTTREVRTLTLTFSPASGASLTGNTTFTFDVSSSVAQWYATQESEAYGSLFTLGIPFAISGNVSSIGSVTATLSNSVGTSAPVLGTE